MLRIYLASSWSNPYFNRTIDTLRAYGFVVYNFKETGFSWAEISPDWQSWTHVQFANALVDPIAEAAFASDYNALRSSDVCVLLLPSGASAHTEAGYMKGQGKRVYVLALGGVRPELMYKLYDGLFTSLNALIIALVG